MNEPGAARGVAVTVTRHALSRARRHGLSQPEVVNEVAAALSAGRVSSGRPRFLSAGTGAQRGRRFAWPDSRRHAYVIEADGEANVVVVTLISAEPGPAETAISQAFRRAGIGPGVEVIS